MSWQLRTEWAWEYGKKRKESVLCACFNVLVLVEFDCSENVFCQPVKEPYSFHKQNPSQKPRHSCKMLDQNHFKCTNDILVLLLSSMADNMTKGSREDRGNKGVDISHTPTANTTTSLFLFLTAKGINNLWRLFSGIRMNHTFCYLVSQKPHRLD